MSKQQRNIEDNHFETYSSGFDVKAQQPITTKTIVGIVDDLKRLFGNQYDFEPEPITEGGILWTQYPGKTDTSYKTMRFHFDSENGKWPWIHTFLQWRNNNAQTIWSNPPNQRGRTPKIEGGTFLKAFFGAPCWTIEEIDKFRSAFEHNGIQCLRNPAKSNLKMLR